MKKELWLKVSSVAEYMQNEAAILSVLRTADAGEDKVILYCEKERSIKTLKYGVQANEELQTSFAALLGDQCVKVVEKQEEKHVHTQYPEIIQIIPCNDEMYAVFNEADAGEESRSKVLAFALCDDGCVYPLMFDGELGISLLSDNEYVKEFVVNDHNRIADILQDVNGALIRMEGFIEALGNCVGYAPPRQGYVQGEGYNFLQIGGSVDTGV